MIIYLNRFGEIIHQYVCVLNPKMFLPTLPPILDMLTYLISFLLLLDLSCID